MTKSMSKGWRDIKAKATMYTEPRKRSWRTFGAWPWPSHGVGGGWAGEAVALGSGLTSKDAGKLRSICPTAVVKGDNDGPAQLLV